VFEIKGNSEITITSSEGTGTITGGYANHGGAININETSTCSIEGGTIQGNKAEDGGGIYLATKGLSH